MKIISTAWIPGTLQEFVAQCTLPVHAELGYQYGGVPLEIFVLAGIEKINKDFVDYYRERGILFHDATSITKVYLKSHLALVGSLDESQGALYELYCYIRWLVLGDLLGATPFLHIDLDLFFQKPIDDVSKIFCGATGTFGSPCLTSVSNPDWLLSYRDSVKCLIDDRKGFQDHINYTGNEFRVNISSDQDLVSALEARNMLPSEGMDDIAEGYSTFINPLHPYYKKKPSVPACFNVIDGFDSIGYRPVLFWHLQNNAADYLGRFAMLESYKQNWVGKYLPCKLGLPFIQLNPTAENFAFYALREYFSQKISEQVLIEKDVRELGFERFFSRTWISQWFILDKCGRDLFSARYWWEDGVFV